MQEVFLHVGTHKTGTSSFQKYLEDFADELKASDFFVFDQRGFHHELHLASMREGIETPPRKEFPSIDIEEYRNNLRKWIHEFIASHENGKFIFSSEHLSYLRTDEECKILRELFPDNVKISVMLVLRDPEEFLESYKKQIIKTSHGDGASKDKNSAYYVEKDSWLIDYDTLVKIYSTNFDELKIFTYRRSGIMKQLLDHIGVKTKNPDAVYRRNKTPRFPLINSEISRIREWLLDSPIGPLIKKVRKFWRSLYINDDH